jgi:hypothetical protein
MKIIDYSHDWDAFAQRINLNRKEEFDDTDRYLIDHSDTDYYLPKCPYGLSMFNLVKTCLHKDIPMNTFVIFTNHIGLHREFEILLPDHMHKHNFPTIIDQCLVAGIENTRLGTKVPDIEFDVKDITKHGISMMGKPRIHRNILFNLIKDHKLLNDYAVSFSGSSDI